MAAGATHLEAVHALWERSDGVPERSRKPAYVLGIVATTALLVGLTLSWLSLRRFDTPAFWGFPERISYCGRAYQNGGGASGTPDHFVGRLAGDLRWQTVGHTLTGRPISGPIRRETQLQPCTMTLYIPTSGSTSSWVRYVLLGGP